MLSLLFLLSLVSCCENSTESWRRWFHSVSFERRRVSVVVRWCWKGFKIVNRSVHWNRIVDFPSLLASMWRPPTEHGYAIAGASATPSCEEPQVGFFVPNFSNSGQARWEWQCNLRWYITPFYCPQMLDQGSRFTLIWQQYAGLGMSSNLCGHAFRYEHSFWCGS